MAVDEAMLWACSLNKIPPTLRLYGWEPPAVSIGYFQEERDFSERQDMPDVDIVKRLTGGGAIYHGNELTFSLVCRCSDNGAFGGVEESYAAIAGAVANGLVALGINAGLRGDPASASPVSGPGRKSPYFCFEKPSKFDVTTDGLKIAGSAQRRRNEAFLHHGSIPIDSNGAAGSTCVREAAGRDISFDELCRVIIAAFEEKLNVRLAERGLGEFEKSFVDKRLRQNQQESLLYNNSPTQPLDRTSA